ncbi:MAG: hypothetical protein FXF47_09805 [Candidatus Mcinerneyibacterium aminivorans]|jgi:hypothetical protein|uniref:Uncharacterized protein n=1 Tax=Candidatus Mcinerneyibacterium aminivorans TaxID=2703815 RepID=A0A5D0M9A6_9BACT|nr:MAG: hypothetical protein FXF47_09805 [Candidatus Mcinerneyibacterium aminivorans]
MNISKNIYKWLVVICLLVFLSSLIFGFFYFLKIKNRYESKVFSFNYPENKKLSFGKKGVYFFFSKNIKTITIKKDKGEIEIFDNIDIPEFNLLNNKPLEKIKVEKNTRVLLESKSKGEIRVINNFNKFVEETLEGKVFVFFIMIAFSFVFGLFSLTVFFLSENKN